MSEGLLDAELKVISLDSSLSMIEFMKEKFADIKEFQAVLTDPAVIKLGDAAVDYAFANMYLHQVENPQDALKEIIRILKPGGKAAVTDLMLHSHEEFMQRNHHRWPGFTFPDLYDWFINAGFKNISIEKLNQSFVIKDETGGEIKIDIFIACGEK
jgi:ubiquinone/menaquinone biosynthesis C-methylase UbiE